MTPHSAINRGTGQNSFLPGPQGRSGKVTKTAPSPKEDTADEKK